MSNLSKLSEEILTQMYAAADPPLDFQEVLDNHQDFDENWYQQHTLSEERQQEIIEEVLEPHKLDERERSKIVMTCTLNYGPSTSENG